MPILWTYTSSRISNLNGISKPVMGRLPHRYPQICRLPVTDSLPLLGRCGMLPPCILLFQEEEFSPKYSCPFVLPFTPLHQNRVSFLRDSFGGRNHTCMFQPLPSAPECQSVYGWQDSWSNPPGGTSYGNPGALQGLLLHLPSLISLLMHIKAITSNLIFIANDGAIVISSSLLCFLQLIQNSERED